MAALHTTNQLIYADMTWPPSNLVSICSVSLNSQGLGSVSEDLHQKIVDRLWYSLSPLIDGEVPGYIFLPSTFRYSSRTRKIENKSLSTHR